MRRMIPSNKARVLDNLAVNANGAIEVGGNVAFESIENIGHLVDGEPIIKEVVVGNPGITTTPPKAGDYTLFKGVKELTGFSLGGPDFPEAVDGDVIFSTGPMYYFAKIGGKIYENAGTDFTLKGDNIQKGDGYQYITGGAELVTVPGAKVLEPFEEWINVDIGLTAGMGTEIANGLYLVSVSLPNEFSGVNVLSAYSDTYSGYFQPIIKNDGTGIFFIFDGSPDGEHFSKILVSHK